MEQKIQLLTKQAPPPAGPYSQGIETEQFVFVSGQRPVDPVTGEMKNGIKSQTEQVIKNVECVLTLHSPYIRPTLSHFRRFFGLHFRIFGAFST